MTAWYSFRQCRRGRRHRTMETLTLTTLVVLLALLLLLLSTSTQQVHAQTVTDGDNGSGSNDGGSNNDTTPSSARQPLLWSSTGGGWRAMFADVGFVNAFKQAGLMTNTSSLFTSVSTTSGGSWFSTQLFYSQPFYDKTAMAETPDDIRQFVLDWMASYASISNTTDEEILASCDTSELEDSRLDPSDDVIELFQQVCYILVKFDFDWTIFIQEMLYAASTDAYDDPTFIDRNVIPELRINPMKETDLILQSSLVPNSRIRNESSIDGNGVGVYLGYTTENINHNNDSSSSSSPTSTSNLFTVVLSAAWVVQSSSAGFVYGYTDQTDNLQAYFTPTQADHSFSDWQDFYLYPTKDGTLTIDGATVGVSASTSTSTGSPLRSPFGGGTNVTVTQVASISSAAAGSGSPRVSSVYSQMFSIPYHSINVYTVDTVWRVLAGIAVAAAAGVFFFVCCVYFGMRFKIYKEEHTAHMVGIFTGTCCGIVLGLLTGFLYGIGSVFLPTTFDSGVNKIYRNESYDNFAVCTQWPNPCGEQDGFFIDGWFVDNPAFVVNVGQYQQQQLLTMQGSTEGATENLQNETLKVILTNTNEEWDTEWNRAQFLQYFSTYFNRGIEPGGFLWGPGFFAPYRSPQIFSEYLDPEDIDALLEPIDGTNLTTALLKGTTVNNPSFGVVEGQQVEILLLNTNTPITTFVVGLNQIELLSEPLADMAAQIAGSEELVRRIQEFVFSLPQK